MIDDPALKDKSEAGMINATRKFVICRREFLPLFHVLSTPMAVVSKNALTI